MKMAYKQVMGANNYPIVDDFISDKVKNKILQRIMDFNDWMLEEFERLGAPEFNSVLSPNRPYFSQANKSLVINQKL